MNYDYPLDGSPAVAPRSYRRKFRTGTTGQAQYGFIDTGADMEGFIYGDGVNEYGVAISTQYFRGYGSYGPVHRAGAMSIMQNEIVTWTLEYTTSVEDMKQQTSQVRVVAAYLNDISEVPPLHYYVSDATGYTVEVSFKEDEMVVKDNPVGVLADHPDLNWHYSNLRQYINISPCPTTADLLGGVTIEPLGSEAGIFGLPGGSTLTERFVGMVLMKVSIAQNNNKEMDLMNAFYLLGAVSMPIGVARPHDADNHYTVYQTAVNLTTRMLYTKYYGSDELVALKPTDDLIDRKDITTFKPEKHIAVRKLNDNQ